MGNRAVITTQDKQLGVYLHWHGGHDSVKAFLAYCKIKGYRCPENDCYGWARLCQVIGNYFGGELSVGIDKYECLDTDNGDNGVYIIKDWTIVGREFEPEEEQDAHDFRGLLHDINNAQPHSEQFTGEELDKAIDELFVKPITNLQIRAIHAIINELGINDKNYRGLLGILFNVKSCKDLTEKQASILIDTLNKVKER